MPKLPACLSNLGAKFILLFPMKVGTVRPPESLAVRSPTYTPEYLTRPAEMSDLSVFTVAPRYNEGQKFGTFRSL